MAEHEMTRWSGMTDVLATCTCGWKAETRNAMGLGAQHARRTGHVVNVRQSISVTWAPAGMDREQVSSQRMAGWVATDT